MGAPGGEQAERRAENRHGLDRKAVLRMPERMLCTSFVSAGIVSV